MFLKFGWLVDKNTWLSKGLKVLHYWLHRVFTVIICNMNFQGIVVYSGPQISVVGAFWKCLLLVSDRSGGLMLLTWELGAKALKAEQALIHKGRL